MTYAVALRLDRGLVFAADTRTNAGLDNIAQYRKLQTWRQPGDRLLVLMSAGNLAVTQSVLSLLNEAASDDDERPTLFNATNMYRATRIVGDAVREARRIDGEALKASRINFNSHFIFGGQIKDERPRLFQIYPEGNFIEAGDDTPFFQIGEHKYGKPILDRVARRDMSLGEAVKLLLLSFDSTLRSNLSVGTPLDLVIYEAGSLDLTREVRIEAEDPYFRKLSADWSEALRHAFSTIDDYGD